MLENLRCRSRTGGARWLLLGGLLAALGCSEKKPVGDVPGSGGTGASEGGSGGGVVPGCTPHAYDCSDNASCCSKICDATTNTCTTTLGACVPPGGSCDTALDCCTVSCLEGLCSENNCLEDGQLCETSPQCCSGTCTEGLCVPLNTSCKTAGNPCDSDEDCCSKLCQKGSCSLGVSFCIQNGETCARSYECCGGVCSIAPEAALGVCTTPPLGASLCKGGFDGMLCNDCSDCCNRLCLPWGSTGRKVCQRASGCHVDGDLCRKDADCCGGDGSGLPGEGNAVCEVQPGQEVGLCRNPKGCNPEGNLCHYGEEICGLEGARSDCCGASGDPQACKLDSFGIPRCHRLTACSPAGDPCSQASACCDGAPCVPDGNGHLRCASPEGGVSCRAAGGSCTVPADCCEGMTCFALPGSTLGVCTWQAPLADSDAGPDAALNDASLCSLYGQACSSSADCCSEVPCRSTSQAALCAAGEAGCRCLFGSP